MCANMSLCDDLFSLSSHVSFPPAFHLSLGHHHHRDPAPAATALHALRTLERYAPASGQPAFAGGDGNTQGRRRLLRLCEARSRAN